MKTIKIYVSLPITGQETTAMKRCLEAKERLERVFEEADTDDYKLEVIFPKDIDKIGTPEQDTTKPLGFWLGEDIKLLMDCDAVYFCKGNEYSQGCYVERTCASVYRKTILEEWYDDSDILIDIQNNA